MFAPADAVDCYELTRTAFAWSERLRTPVVLLSDKEVGTTLEGVDTASLPDDPVEPRRPVPAGTERFAPCAHACPASRPPSRRWAEESAS